VELLPFQGQLKSRTDTDIEKLAASLITDGLLMPFVIWHKPDLTPETQLHYLLDGHARYSAIQKLAEERPELLKAEYPVMIVIAKDIEEAKNALLQISSSYGKITPRGLEAFIAQSPRIKVETLGIKVKLPEVKKVTTDVAPKEVDTVLIKLRVKKQSIQQFTELLKGCDFVELL
jgi:hypothetical protein